MNNDLKRNKPKFLPADERIKHFCEVSLGFDENAAVLEAARCLNCKTRPCVRGCPVGIDIPGFIEKIRDKNFYEAYKIIEKSSSLAAICGRVCPQENQCEARCVRGFKGEAVAIGCLERFVADWFRENVNEPIGEIAQNGVHVAVVGSGPSGLACASELAKNGFDVTVFEALHEFGGVLSYGIPKFRLPVAVVESAIADLKNLGVKFEKNVVVGKLFFVEDLLKTGFDFVYIATGAGVPRFMGIEGEGLKGVYSANEFLTRVNLMQAAQKNSDTPVHFAKKVAVVGGGNVAMDAARVYKRLGAEEVYVIYRRTESEVPARKEEGEHAKEEGIIFKFLLNPSKILGDENGFVRSIQCYEMILGEPDESGRRKPIKKDNSFVELPVDAVVIAIGTSPNPLVKNTTPGLLANERGGIIVDDFGATSLNSVFAGGDAVTGAATVILAMGAGKLAAKTIIERAGRAV